MVFSKKSLRLIFITLLVMTSLLSCLWGPKAIVFAQPSAPPTVPPGRIKNSLAPDILQGGINFVPLVINILLNKTVVVLLTISSLIFFFMIIGGGIRWMTTGGDKEKIAGAKQQLTSAAIGLAITLSVFVIINLIELLFDVDLLQFTIPKL